MEMKRNPFSARSIILILLLCFITGNIMAQKVKLDSLDIDQLNLYKDKAVTMRNAGTILTVCGAGIMLTGFIVGINYDSQYSGDMTSVAIVVFSGMAGIATAVVGIPLWAIGGSRMTKAELTLQKFNVVPENSMALGLGITIRF
jgi:hypothetical protein